MYVNTPDARPRYQDDLTDAHRIVAYDSFTANSGRYEIDGNILKTRAYVAKDTNYMDDWPDNEATFEFTVDGDTMTLKSLTFTATLAQVEVSPDPRDND